MKIKADYYWETIYFDVVDYIKNCITCQLENKFSKITFYKLIKPNFAWHIISIDMIGPLGKSTYSHNYIIVAIDHLTKWIEIFL